MICRIFISTVYLLLFFNLYHDFLFFFDASYTFNSSSAYPPIRYSAPILKMVISPIPTSPRSHTNV